MIRRLAAAALAVLAAVLVASCGGSRSPSGNDIAVSGSGPSASVTPGTTVVFTMTVENVGYSSAQDVRVTNELGGFLALVGITCSAGGGATCPAAPSSVMSIPSLPVGGRLVFQVSAVVNAISGGTVVNTMTANAVDDTGRLNNTATATATVSATAGSLGVAQDVPASVAAGSSATVKLLVANPSGANVAGNVTINWSVAAPFAVSGITYTCTPTGGAACPDAQTPATSMLFSVPSLGSGRSLTFVFTIPVPASGRGNVIFNASVVADGDGDASNNTSSATMVAADARNGSYQVYASDGRPYQLDIDFDAGRYTMLGNGASVERSFTPDGGGSFVVSGTERLRTADDVVIGAHAFAGGVQPYVAARRFATSLAALGGSFNVMTRNTSDSAAAVTHVGTARFSGNVLQLCIDDFEVVQAQACSVGSLKNYLLTISGDVVTATDSANSANSFNFRVARTGGADIVLGVGNSTLGDGTRQFTIGLIESAGLVDSRVLGPGIYANASTDWLQIDITRTTYSALGASIADVAGLFRPDTVAGLPPVAMLQGAPLPTLAGAPIWVMQSYPMVVVVGAPKSASEEANASGLMQIGLP